MMNGAVNPRTGMTIYADNLPASSASDRGVRKNQNINWGTPAMVLYRG